MGNLLYIFFGVIVYLFFGNKKLDNKIRSDELSIDSLQCEVSELESRIEELEG